MVRLPKTGAAHPLRVRRKSSANRPSAGMKVRARAQAPSPPKKDAESALLYGMMRSRIEKNFKRFTWAGRTWELDSDAQSVRVLPDEDNTKEEGRGGFGNLPKLPTFSMLQIMVVFLLLLFVFLMMVMGGSSSVVVTQSAPGTISNIPAPTQTDIVNNPDQFPSPAATSGNCPAGQVEVEGNNGIKGKSCVTPIDPLGDLLGQNKRVDGDTGNTSIAAGILSSLIPLAILTAVMLPLLGVLSRMLGRSY